jgi:hypothetical protein
LCKSLWISCSNRVNNLAEIVDSKFISYRGWVVMSNGGSASRAANRAPH